MRYETPEHGRAALEKVGAMANKDLTAEDAAGAYGSEPGLVR